MSLSHVAVGVTYASYICNNFTYSVDIYKLTKLSWNVVQVYAVFVVSDFCRGDCHQDASLLCGEQYRGEH